MKFQAESIVNHGANIFSVTIITFLFAWFATELVRQHALQNAIFDIPNVRSSHATPTPRGGGLAIVVAFLSGIIFLLFAGLLEFNIALVLLAGGSAIALIGYMDDRHSLRARVRICVHISAGIVTVVLLGGITDQTLRKMGIHGIWTGGFLGIMAVIWSTNFFNFMDGIDGIAGSEAVFVAGAGALLNFGYGGDVGLGTAMLLLAAASSGFLIWNWPPARIFMGDVGSGFLGFAIAVLGLAASHRSGPPIEAWAILNGVFLIDSTVTLLRRVVRGDRWFEAHRMHAYQNLARRWNAHLSVTLLVLAINLFWLLPWAWIAVVYPARAMLYLIVALAPLVAIVLLVGADCD